MFGNAFQGRCIEPFARPFFVIALFVATMGAAASATRELSACPFCFGSLQLTLRERIDTSDATVIVRWKSGEPGDLNRELPATTTFEIIEVSRGGLDAGASLTIARFQEGRPGDVFLMSGSLLEDAVKWDRSIPLSAEGLKYVRNLPASTAPVAERLRYVLCFLESADDTVATDAFTVLAAARYEDMAALRSELPKEKLRRWVFGGDRIKGQLSVYGMLLGLCGDASDSRRLEAIILNTRGPDDFRLGISGVMGGYLLLAKTEGLEVLERSFLTSAEASSSDRAAAMKALRFVGAYAEECVGKDRLAGSVRRSLATAKQPENAIADLARWQDWSATDRLLQWYDAPQKPDRHVRKAIIYFMMAAAQADREGLSDRELKSLDAAAKFVETLQKKEPALYKQAARGFIPRS